MPLLKYFKFLLVITLSASLLTACGGGGGSSTDTSTNETSNNGTVSGVTTATKPTATALTKSIEENTTAVATLTANGNGSAITSYALIGGDSALFNISATGVITAKKAFDFEAVPTKTSFTFQATATNAVGTSDPVTVTITLTDVADIKPTATGLTKSIPENTTAVATLTANGNGSAITSYALIGGDSALFNISATGVITAKKAFDFEAVPTKTSFTFQATATNAAGTSEPVTVTITLTDIADIKPTATALTKSIPENTTAVATLTANSNDSAITGYTIMGGDSALFNISATGVITAKKAFDFEAIPTKTSFTFQATATNAVGTSDPVTVTITLTDVADNTPTVTGATFKLLESAKSETVVGQLTITQGDAVVSSATLTGTGATNFNIATDGTISVTSGTPSLGQDFTLTATISNQHGDSTATVTIDTFKASFAGTTGLTGAATPKLMPLGDSITSGRGEELTLAIATKAGGIIESLDNALTSIIAAHDNIKTDGSVDLTATLNNATAAQTAIIAAQTALTDHKANTPNVPTTYEIPVLTESKTAIDAAITALNTATLADFADAREKTATAKNNIRNTNRNAYGAIQRLTYREPLFTKATANANVNYTVIGRNAGPVSTTGAALFGNADKTDSKHDGYSGSFADLNKTAFLVLDTELKQSIENGNIPDLVLLHIGTNDIAFGNDIEGHAASIAGVKEVIKTLRASNSEVVILLANIIPLVESNLEYRGGTAVNAYNADLTTLVNDDKHPTSKLILVDHNTPFAAGASLYVGDGVHPNATGDEIMATTWFTELEKLFQAAP